MTHDHLQTVISDSWRVIHDLNSHPTIVVMVEVNGKSRRVFPQKIEYISQSEIQIVLPKPYKGLAHLSC